MRHKTYVRKILATGETERLAFEQSHYTEAHTLYTPLVGMHEASALELVNKWNRSSDRCKYWIE